MNEGVGCILVVVTWLSVTWDIDIGSSSCRPILESSIILMSLLFCVDSRHLAVACYTTSTESEIGDQGRDRHMTPHSANKI